MHSSSPGPVSGHPVPTPVTPLPKTPLTGLGSEETWSHLTHHLKPAEEASRNQQLRFSELSSEGGSEWLIPPSFTTTFVPSPSIEEVLATRLRENAGSSKSLPHCPISIPDSDIDFLSDEAIDPGKESSGSQTSDSTTDKPNSTGKPNSNVPVSTVWGIPFHAVTMARTLEIIDRLIHERQPTYAITANLNYAMLCAKHPGLKQFTERAALVVCDGMPILWRTWLNQVRLPERVAGSDLIYRLAERSETTGARIYLYGAAEGVAEKAAAELRRLYPRCNIVGVQCPPFCATSEAEIQLQINKIKQANPDILLVALGQPKGEFWIEKHLAELGVPVSIQVGASFDFVAGIAKRAPKFLQWLGLEWFYRAINDPIRLVPRYFSNGLFLLKMLRLDAIDWLDTPTVPTRMQPKS